jgi:hypothetical protein
MGNNLCMIHRGQNGTRQCECHENLDDQADTAPQVNPSSTAASTGTISVHDKILVAPPAFMEPGFHSRLGSTGNGASVAGFLFTAAGQKRSIKPVVS